MKKVVVTGIGAVTAIGNNVNDYWEGLISGKCGMKTISRIPVEEHDTTVAAEVDDSFEAERGGCSRNRHSSERYVRESVAYKRKSFEHERNSEE